MINQNQNYSHEMIHFTEVDKCFVETLHLLLSKCHPVSAFPVSDSSALFINSFSIPPLLSLDYGFGGFPHFLSLICSVFLLSFSMISLSDLKRLVCRDALVFLAIRWKRAVDIFHLSSSSSIIDSKLESSSSAIPKLSSFSYSFPQSCSLTGSFLLDKYVLLLLSFNPSSFVNSLLGSFIKQCFENRYLTKDDKFGVCYEYDFMDDHFSLFSPFVVMSLSDSTFLNESLSFVRFTETKSKQQQFLSNIPSSPSSTFDSINFSSHNSSISSELFSLCINQQYDKYIPLLQKCYFFFCMCMIFNFYSRFFCIDIFNQNSI
jgi:hypothetical protein